MDGIAAINDRIAAIQRTIATVVPLPVDRTASATASVAGTSFASVLASEVAGTGSTSGAGTLTAQGVPVELERYGNGQIPLSALATIGTTGQRLWVPAAGAYEKLTEAAARAGVTIGITDSYRTYESQVDLVARKGLYSQGGLAAEPGTSNHGWGRSLDLDLDANALAWMRTNAATYGFAADVPRESWHWTYTPPTA
ncbi:MAG: M15 family metallopeptidase [Cellulomonas sp.]